MVSATAEPLHRSNANALKTLDVYDANPVGQPNARSSADYQGIFQIDPAKIRPGDLLLDAGAGYGVAATGLAKKANARAVIINAQDTWGEIARAGDVLKKDGQAAITAVRTGRKAYAPDRVAGVSAHALQKLGADLGLKTSALTATYASAQEAQAAALPVARRVIEAAKALQASGQIQFHPGFAEEFVGGYRGKVKLLFDCYGAYTYSPERLALILQYYEALKPGGVAHILTGEHKAHTIVKLLEPRWQEWFKTDEQELIDFLCERYPKIFSQRFCKVFPHGGSTILTIRRQPGVSSLDLPLIFRGEVSYGPGGEMPQVTLHELR